MSDPASPGSADEPVLITRSEERLAITTRRVPIATAIVRKVVVVEQRTITIDVAHEEVHVVHVPIEEGGDQDGGPSHGAHLALPNLVLHEEQVVITRRTVPVERVRVVVTSVNEDLEVTGDLRRERIVLTDDSTPR